MLKSRFIRLALLLVLFAELGLGIFTPVPEVSSAPNAPTSVAHISDVPIEAHRRAAQHLEEMRFTEMAPGWERAALGENVRFLYRPDDPQNPAYYEFPVVIPALDNQPAGFIILAANENDFPIPHWDFSGDPPTVILDKESNYTAVTYYKLDTLSYVAENDDGGIAATLGQLPPKISGMSMDWLEQPQQLSESAWVPDQTPADDGAASTISGTLVITGATPPPALQISGWDSWANLKTDYATSYAVFLEEQKREASEVWEAEAANRDYGIVLERGDVYDVALLWMTPTVSLDGPGLAYISTQTVSQGSALPELFRITVAGTVPEGFTPFTATVAYGNGANETIKFQIVQLQQVYIPLLATNWSADQAPASRAAYGPDRAPNPSAVSGSWSSWTYYWAGSHDDQRLYSQIPAGEAPNTSGCVSGCGATAWGMLFGWADKRAASGSSYWAPRWGLYRANGGYGADAVAPRNWDSGVKNMLWEIRQDIDTFCAFGQGATAPWDMDEASGYLAGRTGTRLYTHYNAVGIHEGGLRERARNSIRDRDTPAIIGTGWLNHYPLAYGYRWRSRRQCVLFVCWTDYDRQFYVNQGWGGNSNGWISAGTWFAGEIRP